MKKYVAKTFGGRGGVARSADHASGGSAGRSFSGLGLGSAKGSVAGGGMGRKCAGTTVESAIKKQRSRLISIRLFDATIAKRL
jgi:hypothetical protein